MTDRRPGPLLALAGAGIALVGMWMPWYRLEGVGAARNGFAFATGVCAVVLVLASIVTAFAPKRRTVTDQRGPLTLGLAYGVIAAGLLILRAAISPGPASASPHVERQIGLWIVIVGALVTVAGLAITRHETSRRRAEQPPPPSS